MQRDVQGRKRRAAGKLAPAPMPINQSFSTFGTHQGSQWTVTESYERFENNKSFNAVPRYKKVQFHRQNVLRLCSASHPALTFHVTRWTSCPLTRTLHAVQQHMECPVHTALAYTPSTVKPYCLTCSLSHLLTVSPAES